MLSGRLRRGSLLGGGVVHWFLLRPLPDLDGADLLADKLLRIVAALSLGRLGGARAGAGLLTTRDVWAFLVVPWGGRSTR